MTDTSTPDSKVLICLNHGAEDPESVLTSYLVGLEALRANKQALMFLTKEAVHVATPGFAETIDVPGAPSIAKLHKAYVREGGRFFVCPVSVRVREMNDSEWVPAAQVTGMSSVFEYTAGGALVFNY